MHFKSTVSCAGLLVALGAGAFVACSSPSNSATGSVADSGSDSAFTNDGPGVSPVAGLTPDLVVDFYDGQTQFDTTLQAADGLGPLYTKQACSDCHAQASRGPGASTKMAVIGADGMTALTDQSLLAFGDTEHPNVVTQIPGAHTPILPPFDGGMPDGDAGTVSIRVSTRLGPPLFGRGYIEAIEEDEIETIESLQAARTDGIHGHANHVTFQSQPNPDQTFDNHQPGDSVIGRFGLKARIATIDEFGADALQGDMGITSPMRPTEFKNPDGIADDLKVGVDVTADQMNARAMYVRLLAIPSRAQDQVNGQSWFEQCQCNACHVESLHTSINYPIPQLANVDVSIYTDLLLHDMGDNLADGVTEGEAGPRDWRTAPLIGMRFSTTFLHDGRATSITDAIQQHAGPGSEATNAVDNFNKLTPYFQQQLVAFVAGL